MAIFRWVVRAVLCCCLIDLSAAAGEFSPWIEAELPRLLELYRHFHAHPELSHQEVATAARLAEELKSAGFVVTSGIGGHGVVGLLENGPGPVVMFRADLDALPVVEQTGLPFASKVTTKNDQGAEVGVMHACGHDVHITHLVGLARFLAAHRDRWSGTAMLLGQPAEEHGAGAQAMLKDGVFTRFPRPSSALAFHVDSRLEAGKLGYVSGYSHANVDTVLITIRGRGGHGAAPHSAIDPIVIAAHLVIDLQTIVSREVPPLESAVVTVGAIHGGTKSNIIPDRCELQLTVRTTSPAMQQLVLTAIERKAKAAALSARAPEPIVRVSETTPALLNHESLLRPLIPVLKSALGSEQVMELERTMGGEDFSEFGLAGVPICMLRVGSVRKDRLEAYAAKGEKAPPLHAPDYFPDVDLTLTTALEASAACFLSLCPKPPAATR